MGIPLSRQIILNSLLLWNQIASERAYYLEDDFQKKKKNSTLLCKAKESGREVERDRKYYKVEFLGHKKNQLDSKEEEEIKKELKQTCFSFRFFFTLLCHRFYAFTLYYTPHFPHNLR